MSLNGSARGDAVYNAIKAANPNFSQASAAEQASLKSMYETMFSADTTYLTGNATITPGGFNVALGIPVATTGTATAQTGATTAPQVVGGTGLLS